jgi:dihydrofolate reductase
MRKVTAGLFSSIDGVVEAPDQWQPAFDDEMGAALSRMLEEQDAVLLGRVTLIKGSVAEFVADLKQQDGGTIGAAGSPSLVRSLIKHGLLDELTLMISPVVAGGGRAHLFPDDAALGSFELVEGRVERLLRGGVRHAP